MPDDIRTPPPDRNRVDMSEPYQARDWARRFNVSLDELAVAVQRVGLAPGAVEEYLKSH